MWPWLCIFTLFEKILLGFACAQYQQEVPAGDSPLICTLSSTHSAEKPISIGEYWMVIGQCKKSARVRLVDQSHGPYISCCSHQNQHNLPCFGSRNSSVATFSGEFQYDMASKQPVFIEVPDDDFPDSGASEPSGSPVIQGSAQCHNEHIQRPLGGRLERRLEVHHHITQEIDGEALVTDGRSQHGCGPLIHSQLQLCLSAAAPHH